MAQQWAQTYLLLGQVVSGLAAIVVLAVWGATQGHAQVSSSPFHFTFTTSLLDLASLSIVTLLRLVGGLTITHCCASDESTYGKAGSSVKVVHLLCASVCATYGTVKTALVASRGLSKIATDKPNSTASVLAVLVVFLVGYVAEAVTTYVQRVYSRAQDGFDGYHDAAANGHYVSLPSDENVYPPITAKEMLHLSRC